LAVAIVILLTGSAFIKYLDIIPAQIVLTDSTPPTAIVAHASGKIQGRTIILLPYTGECG